MDKMTDGIFKALADVIACSLGPSTHADGDDSESFENFFNAITDGRGPELMAGREFNMKKMAVECIDKQGLKNAKHDCDVPEGKCAVDKKIAHFREHPEELEAFRIEMTERAEAERIENERKAEVKKRADELAEMIEKVMDSLLKNHGNALEILASTIAVACEVVIKESESRIERAVKYGYLAAMRKIKEDERQAAEELANHSRNLEIIFKIYGLGQQDQLTEEEEEAWYDDINDTVLLQELVKAGRLVNDEKSKTGYSIPTKPVATDSVSPTTAD